jgi:hypothetical protein
MRDSRRLNRLATLLWIAFIVVVWNGVFDYEIKSAARLYVFQQSLFRSGRGPEVGIDDIMRPATTRGALDASLCAGGLAAIGAVVLRRASHRAPAR